jgi:hypothetical protein
MRLQLRRMPGGHNPPRFRCYFDNNSAERGLEWYVVGDMTTLRDFLTGKLDMPQSVASRLSMEAESTGSSYTELPLLNDAELRLMLRGWQAEARLAEEGRGKTLAVQ